MKQLNKDLQESMPDDKLAELDAFKTRIDALATWKDFTDDRLGSLELDMRSEDGLVSSQVRECRSAAAAGDAGSFTASGYTISNEEGVLALIQPLESKNNYGAFLNMKILLSLAGDSITSLSENMLLHKATRGADFEDTYSARVNTAYVVNLPSVFGHKATTGDAVKTVWNSGFKSHSAYAGGLKNGGKTTTERQIRKVVEMCRGQIRRRVFLPGSSPCKTLSPLQCWILPPLPALSFWMLSPSSTA